MFQPDRAPPLTEWVSMVVIASKVAIAAAHEKGGPQQGALRLTPAEACNIDGCKVVCEGGQQPRCTLSAVLQGVQSRHKVPDLCLVVKPSRHKARPVGVDMYRGDIGACTMKETNLGATFHPTELCRLQVHTPALRCLLFEVNMPEIVDAAVTLARANVAAVPSNHHAAILSGPDIYTTQLQHRHG